MNTKQFIELLQKIDPEGLATVVINNHSIIGANLEPGYTDGHYWKCLNEENDECVNEYPSKMILTGSGLKLNISYIEPETLIYDNIESKNFNIENFFEFDSDYLNIEHQQEQKEEWMKTLNELCQNAKRSLL